MDAGERPSTIRTRPQRQDPPDVVDVDDLARTIVNLLVNGADVRAESTLGGVRVSVVDRCGHRLELVERPTRSD